MATNSRIKTALLRMLAPLIKMLINNNVSYQELNQIIQQSYVEVAQKEFRLPNKKQSFSRIALLTGINRKDVQKILKQVESEEPATFRQNAALAVVGGWSNDPNFQNKTLPLEGDNSFTSLIHQYSGDIPVRAILDELLRVGTVERDSKNNITLVSDVYVPEKCRNHKFEMITESARDLFISGEHNLRNAAPDDRMQLFVAYDQLSAEAAKQFKQLSDDKSLALLKEFDAWLHVNEIPKAERQQQQAYRAGLGLYYFEEPNNKSEN